MTATCELLRPDRTVVQTLPVPGNDCYLRFGPFEQEETVLLLRWNFPPLEPILTTLPGYRTIPAGETLVKLPPHIS